MTRTRMRAGRWPAMAALGATLMLLTAACGGGDGGGGGGGAAQPPTANMAPPTSIGPGEGKLDLIAWEGYVQPLWTKAFETKTGCDVSAKYAGSSDEMVTLMADGGGGQYDMVSDRKSVV